MVLLDVFFPERIPFVWVSKHRRSALHACKFKGCCFTAVKQQSWSRLWAAWCQTFRTTGSGKVPGQVPNDRFRSRFRTTFRTTGSRKFRGSGAGSERQVPGRFRTTFWTMGSAKVPRAGSDSRVPGSFWGRFRTTGFGAGYWVTIWGHQQRILFFPIRVNFPRLRGHSFTATTSPLLSVISSVWGREPMANNEARCQHFSSREDHVISWEWFENRTRTLTSAYLFHHA